MSDKEIALQLTKLTIELHIAIINNNRTSGYKNAKEIYDEYLKSLNKGTQ